MITSFEPLGPQSTVDDAADALLRTTQHEFPVVDGGGRLRGILTRNAMIRAMKLTGPGTPVIDIMTTGIPTIHAGQPLERALRHMREDQAAYVGVVADDGRLVGYISQENLAELMMFGDGSKPAEAMPPA